MEKVVFEELEDIIRKVNDESKVASTLRVKKQLESIVEGLLKVQVELKVSQFYEKVIF